MFIILFCFVWGHIAADKNIAAEGKASQIDNFHKGYGHAEAAIDGNTDGRMKQGKSVTFTRRKGRAAWWRLDFSKTYEVSEIRIWNRNDCCSKRLNGAVVVVNDNTFVGMLSTQKGNPNVFKVDLDVQRLAVFGRRSYLSLAEVEVFGRLKYESSNDKNIAREGKASQSDNHNSKVGHAPVAIDGNTDGRWTRGSVTHTKSKGKAAYWRLDFSETYYVSKIKIYNRVDCCSERLDGVTVRDNDNKLLGVLNTSKGNPNVLIVNRPINRIIVIGGKDVLSLAEVEVFGPGKKEDGNIASKGKASQSDNLNSKVGHAPVAIDGNTDGRWTRGSVTHTKSKGKAAYWRLDFSETYYVSKIKIYNRVDCCSARLDGVTVRDKDNKLLGVLNSRNGNPNVLIVNRPIDSILVIGGKDFLSLAEVEVFGPGKKEDVNIASEGKASQSDNLSSKVGHAPVAIDGNTDGRWTRGSVTHTKSKGKAAYWRLDFSKSYYVSTIRIWNRIDCCSDRLNGVIVTNQDRKILGTLNTARGNPNVLNVNGFIKQIVIIGGTSYVSLAEVEVFGHIEVAEGKNIAREGKASQVDNIHRKYGHAAAAIDGNTDGRWRGRSVTHTRKIGKAAWWRLDFPKTYIVSKIRIWNNVDFPRRFNGVTVKINDDTNVLATLNTRKGNPNVIKVNGDVKSITINGGAKGHLSLAEVEVFGRVKADSK